MQCIASCIKYIINLNLSRWLQNNGLLDHWCNRWRTWSSPFKMYRLISAELEVLSWDQTEKQNAECKTEIWPTKWYWYALLLIFVILHSNITVRGQIFTNYSIWDVFIRCIYNVVWVISDRMELPYLGLIKRR